MKNNFLLYSLILISLLLLIIFPDICVGGAKSGLLLWFNTVLPTLFPFFIVSKLIINLQMWPKSLFKFYPYIIGIHAGYPNGAIAVYEAVNDRKMDKENAVSALAFCNIASPIFLISYIGYSSLHNFYNKYLIWFVVVLGSFITSFIVKLFYMYIKKPATNVTGFDTNNIICATENHSASKNILEDVIMKSCEVLVFVGAYIIIFSIYAAFITMLPLSKIYTAALSGLFEITCGINLISDMNININTKYILAACITGFGGLSSAFQSRKYITDAGLSFINYIIHKALCGVICMLIMYLYIMTQGHL